MFYWKLQDNSINQITPCQLYLIPSIHYANFYQNSNGTYIYKEELQLLC